MTAKRKIVAIDAETDPFKHGRIPIPFIWGSFDGNEFLTFKDGAALLEYWKSKNVYLYAHNGGKFDFMFLLPYFEETSVLLINSRIVQMRIGNAMLRDSYSIIPMPLKDYVKDDIELWKFEKECRADHMPEITSYLKTDCVSLYNLVSGFRERAGNRPTIAGNALAFARKLGLDPGKTSHKYDEKFRPFYHGGRVEAYLPGHHKNVNIFDIKSAYPYAMCQMLPSGKYFIDGDNLDHFTIEEIQRCFIELECHSHGAFPIRTKDSGLDYPDEFGTYHTTGWEYLIAKKHGLISQEKIKRVILHEETITFKPYVDYWFNEKEIADARDDSVARIIAKIMLNSLYGKLAQDPTNFRRYKICNAGTSIDYDAGWIIDAEMAEMELHSRPMTTEFELKHGDDWQWHDIHYNVATAASVTGCARSVLLDAIHTVGRENVAYCDTDCIFTIEGTDLSKLDRSGKLGSWEWEGKASEAFIAGKKLYAVQFISGPKFEKAQKSKNPFIAAQKIATKGGKLSFEEMADITRGKIIEWKNDAPTFSIRHNSKTIISDAENKTFLGLPKHTKFITRNIRATAKRAFKLE